MKEKYVIGIDEVGRGPLAGPVVVCAVAIPTTDIAFKNTPKTKLNDSKKLSVKARKEWNLYIRKHPNVFFALSRVSPQRIDRINISKAANAAAYRALQSVTRQTSGFTIARICLDGGLYLKSKKHQETVQNATTIIKGDQKIPAIMAASVIAKVSRDAYMAKLAKEYPQYGFEEHKGYGTARHLRALRRHGPSEAHRLTFIS